MDNFVTSFFKTFPQTNFILDTYNQFLENITEIIQHFDFKYTYKNKLGELITINYILEDESNQIKQISEQDVLNAYLCRNRTNDLVQKFQFKISFRIVKGNKEQEKIIPSDKRFFFEIPILSLTSQDPVLKMNILEKWQNGIDLNTLGGDLILAGVKYILPNLFSFPYNKPIVVVADKAKQVVRTEYLRQERPIFGNSYYTSYHIVVDKNKIPDIVVYIKQNHDQRFNKDNKKTTPIYVPILLLFYAYGIKNDLEFLQICDKFNDKQFRLFLINCIRLGEFHKTLQTKSPNFRNNPRQILAKYILIPDYQSQIDQVLNKYIHPLNSNFYIILQDIIYKMYQVYLDPSKSFDKDSLQNKRIKTVAEQVVEQLRSRMSENYKTKMFALEDNQLKDQPFDTIECMKENLENTMLNYATDITKTIKRSFTSPNSTMAIQQSSSLKKVQNEYKTVNYDLIQKREIVIRSEGKGKTTWQQRKVQNSFFGFIDPIQTPEAGINVGRYLSPTIYAQITKGQKIEKVLNFIQNHPFFIKENVSHNIHLMPIRINYITHGFVDWKHFKQLYLDLLKWRQNDFDNTFISIYYSIEHIELNILTDMGRIMIPIIHEISSIEELNQKDTKTLLKEGKLMFVCPEMMNNFIVNEFPKFYNLLENNISKEDFKEDIQNNFQKTTSNNQLSSQEQVQNNNSNNDVQNNLQNNFQNSSSNNTFQNQAQEKSSNDIQLNPSLYYLLPYATLSPITSTNPFIGHMKSVRASYSCPQQKQGITCPNTNFMNQMPNNQLILHKLQRSPIQTYIQNNIYKHIPMGNLIYAAIMEYCFNQEDAIVASQGYFNRGGLQVSEYKTIQLCLSTAKTMFNYTQESCDKHKDQYHLLKPSQQEIEQYIKTNQEIKPFTKHYIPQYIGMQVNYNDVLIPMINIQDKMISIRNMIYQNESDTKYVLISNVNQEFCQVNQSTKMTRIQLARQTNIGDKFISRNAQKGTIGKILHEWELPLDRLGFIPNFIISSESILKRETYGQLIEPLMNKYLCQHGIYIISYDIHSNFDTSLLSTIQPTILIGPDGIPIKNEITTGPITYIPYCHLIDNKIRARNDGAIDQVIKQPISGKKYDGGLKTGTLDVSSLFAQGIINTMRHQFGQNSSNCQWYYCKRCNYIATYYEKQLTRTKDSQKFYCENCQRYLQDNEVGYGSYNYGLKFYNDVLYSIGCGLKLNETKDEQ